MTRSSDDPNGTDRPAEQRPAGGQGKADGGPAADGLGGLALAGLGFQFAASLVVFYFLGQWLDRRLGTAPVFLLGCVFVGAGASFYAMYTQLMRAQRREDAARRGGPTGGTGGGRR
jgi:hypothetical protein